MKKVLGFFLLSLAIALPAAAQGPGELFQKAKEQVKTASFYCSARPPMREGSRSEPERTCRTRRDCRPWAGTTRNWPSATPGQAEPR
jgi:hypothetical protein